MMKKMRFLSLKQGILATACLVLTFGFTACSDDDNGGGDDGNETPVSKIYEGITEDDKSDNSWIYFSFEKGDTVKIDKSNYQASKDWDIAFCKYYVRTNSGVSTDCGALGGAVATGKDNFDAVTVVPAASEFIVDENIAVQVMGGGTKNFTGCKAFSIRDKYFATWYYFLNPVDFPGEMGYVGNETVFVVRTADGKKYAKLKLKMSDTLDANGKPTQLGFSYVYPFK